MSKIELSVETKRQVLAAASKEELQAALDRKVMLVRTPYGERDVSDAFYRKVYIAGYPDVHLWKGNHTRFPVLWLSDDNTGGPIAYAKLTKQELQSLSDACYAASVIADS